MLMLFVRPTLRNRVFNGIYQTASLLKAATVPVALPTRKYHAAPNPKPKASANPRLWQRDVPFAFYPLNPEESP
jgi:hypothetical protein